MITTQNQLSNEYKDGVRPSDMPPMKIESRSIEELQVEADRALAKLKQVHESDVAMGIQESTRYFTAKRSAMDAIQATLFKIPHFRYARYWAKLRQCSQNQGGTQ